MTPARHARHQAAVELIRAGDAMRDAARHGAASTRHRQRLLDAEARYDRLTPRQHRRASA